MIAKPNLRLDSVRLVAAVAVSKQLPILREHVKKDREQHEIGIRLLVLTFTSRERVAYLGDKYKFSFSKDRNYFQLQSDTPINFKPVPKNIDLRALVAQRTSIYERLNQRSAGQ